MLVDSLSGVLRKPLGKSSGTGKNGNCGVRLVAPTCCLGLALWMPELPEVETVVRDLRSVLPRSTITAVWISRRPLRIPWRSTWTRSVVGRRIDFLERRGKWIIVKLDDQSSLVVHLGMTGQLRVCDPQDPSDEHVHARLQLDTGGELRFRDIRRFGSLRWIPPFEAVESVSKARLGPEPWDTTAEQLGERLRRSRRTVKALLLDQSVVAGVGNIYADEALFAARISPVTLGRQLTDSQVRRLHRALNQVLRRAIEARGTTIRNYVGGSGLGGGFQQRLQVYARAGQPCRRCRGRLQRIRVAGRSTHFCPHCQRPSNPASEAESCPSAR